MRKLLGLGWRRFARSLHYLIAIIFWGVARIMHTKKIPKPKDINHLNQGHLQLMPTQPLPPKVRQQCVELLAEMFKGVITLERKEASRER